MASESNIYTCGRIMAKIQVDSVTSEEAGFPIENALDFNLNTGWKPTDISDQVIATDLNNGLDEMITLLLDRDFNTAVGTNWANISMNVFNIFGGVLALVADAVSQTCELASGGISPIIKTGSDYRLTYDHIQDVASFSFQQVGSGGAMGIATAGVGQTNAFTADRDSNGFIIATNTDTATGSFDNFSLKNVTDEDDYEVDGYALFIRNYKTNFGPDAGLLVEYSDEGTVWTEFADTLIESEMTNTTGQPVRIYINSTSQKRRYWRFTFHDMDEIIEVGQLFLLRTRAISLGNVWPERDRDRFLNKFSNRQGSVPFTIQGPRRPIRYIPRRWQFIPQAAMDALNGSLDDSFGSLRPVIFNETDSYRVVTFLQDDIDPNESAYQVYSPQLLMQELTYIEDGQVF